MPHFYNNVMARARRKGLQTSKDELQKIAERLGCTLEEGTSRQITEAVHILQSRLAVSVSDTTVDIHTQETQLQTPVEDTAALVRRELADTGVSLTVAQQEQITNISNRVISNQTAESLSQIEIVRQSIREYLQAQKKLGKDLLQGLAQDIRQEQAAFESELEDDLAQFMMETATEQSNIDARFKKKCAMIAGAWQEATQAIL